MSTQNILTLAGMIILAIIIALTLVARRLDRLHTSLMKSRRALEHALTARAQAAHDFAACGALDMAASVVLAESADLCLREGMNPLVADGLDSLPDLPLIGEGAAERTALESALSRTLRLTVDELAELEGLNTAGLLPPAGASGGASPDESEEGGEAGGANTPPELALSAEQFAIFSQLQRARLDVRMTRSFHNSHVDQARRLRRNPLVRLFHLAGGAPLPLTVDIDDE